MNEILIKVVDSNFDELNKYLQEGYTIKNIDSCAAPVPWGITSCCYVHLIK